MSRRIRGHNDSPTIAVRADPRLRVAAEGALPPRELARSGASGGSPETARRRRAACRRARLSRVWAAADPVKPWGGPASVGEGRGRHGPAGRGLYEWEDQPAAVRRRRCGRGGSDVLRRRAAGAGQEGAEARARRRSRSRQARRQGEADRPAAPARRPALLGARRDGAAQHRVEQQARRDAHDGPPRRPRLSGRSRPTSARSSRSRAATPRCSSTSPRSASGASSSSSRRRTSTSSAASPRPPRSGRTSTTPGLVARGRTSSARRTSTPQTGKLIAADPAASPTAPGENLFDFLQTLGMKTMGFSGNLSQPEHARRLGQPDHRGDHLRLRRAGAEHVNRIGEILRDRGVKYFFHPEQDNYRYFDDPAQPELGHGAPDPVGDGEHRPEAVRVGDRHPAQLVGPRALPERDHAPAGHQRLGARPGGAEARDGLAHQGRLPEHGADRGRGRAARPRAAARRTSRRSCARRRSRTR